MKFWKIDGNVNTPWNFILGICGNRVSVEKKFIQEFVFVSSDYIIIAYTKKS